MKTATRKRLRDNRKKRVKSKLKQRPGNRPRLTVFKSAKHIYAQIIDDQGGKTLVSDSTVTKTFKEQMKNGGNIKAAIFIGTRLGEKALEKGIQEVCYDRSGFIFAGRVKALADAVREKGIKF